MKRTAFLPSKGLLVILLLLFNLTAFIGHVSGQQKVVTGKVTDDKGEGIANVSVSVQGVARVVLTGSDGTFNITANKGQTLVFSSVGYKIITTLLDEITTAVIYPERAYSKVLLARIPQQYEVRAETPYGRIQAVLDYISGMTDIYALDLYQKINGTSLPVL